MGLESLPLDTCLVKTMIEKKAIEMGISIFPHLAPFGDFAKKMKVVTTLYHLHEI